MEGRIEVMRFPVNIVKQIRTEYGNRCDRSFVISKTCSRHFKQMMSQISHEIYK